MFGSLRLRLILAITPLTVLLAALGGMGYVMLERTGHRIEAILRENFVSVQAMYELNEALERIDSSLQFALAGKEIEAKKQFEDSWKIFDQQFEIEAANVTIHPFEDQYVETLRQQTARYRESTRQFFLHPPGTPNRDQSYFANDGLLAQFREIKKTSREILRINRENMEFARDEARDSARTALLGFSISLAVVALLVAGAAWYLVYSIVTPIRAVTDAAHAIGISQQLDRQVPVFGRDELGQLADAFNAMTRQLREYRMSNLSKLLRAQKTAQATVDSFPDPILVLNLAGHVELANPAARQVFGVDSNSESTMASVWQPPESLRPMIHDALTLQRFSSAESFDQTITFRMGNEEHAYLPQIRLIRGTEDETLGAAVVLADVTRFRLLDQFKTDLVATVSHELKTPLTSVRLAVHILLEETIGPLTAKQTELLVDARENSERLLLLIDQLLALARLQQPEGGERRKKESLQQLIQNVAENARQRAEDKHVNLIVNIDEELPSIEVDGERIKTALGNLLQNAITYTPPGGKVTIHCKRDDNQLAISISDTGVGIPTEYLPQLFERFFRIPGQSDPHGTGLGLAIVKEIVSAHGGTISATSELGHGTQFVIRLPIAMEGNHNGN